MSELKLVGDRALKLVQWYSEEIVHQEDLNGLHRLTYQMWCDILATLVGGEYNDAVVMDGLELIWSTSLTSYLQAGAAVCFDGTYGETSTFMFNAEAGKPFAVMVPVKQAVAVDSGSASDRFDTVEIRPKVTSYEQRTRDFKDPDNGVVTPTSVNTRIEYGFEFQVLKGTSGGGAAPTHTSGWIKIAEVFVEASASAIDQDDIKDYRESAAWTTEPSETVLWEPKRAVYTGWPILVDHYGEEDVPFG